MVELVAVVVALLLAGAPALAAPEARPPAKKAGTKDALPPLPGVEPAAPAPKEPPADEVEPLAGIGDRPADRKAAPADKLEPGKVKAPDLAGPAGAAKGVAPALPARPSPSSRAAPGGAPKPARAAAPAPSRPEAPSAHSVAGAQRAAADPVVAPREESARAATPALAPGALCEELRRASRDRREEKARLAAEREAIVKEREKLTAIAADIAEARKALAEETARLQALLDKATPQVAPPAKGARPKGAAGSMTDAAPAKAR